MAETVTEVRQQAQDRAQEAAAKASDRIRSQVDRRSTDAGERVRGTADDIRSVSHELRKQGKDGPARMAEQAADRVERMGGWLRDSDADRLLDDIEEFGRRQPWVIALGGLALGFAASRFLKASSERRYGARRGSGQPEGMGNGEIPSLAQRPLAGDETATVAPGGVSGVPTGPAEPIQGTVPPPPPSGTVAPPPRPGGTMPPPPDRPGGR